MDILNIKSNSVIVKLKPKDITVLIGLIQSTHGGKKSVDDRLFHIYDVLTELVPSSLEWKDDVAAKPIELSDDFPFKQKVAEVKKFLREGGEH